MDILILMYCFYLKSKLGLGFRFSSDYARLDY